MSFGDRLRDYRIAARLKQSELAEAIGVSLRTLRKYELEETKPNVARIQQLSAVLHVPIHDLVGEQEAILVDAYERGGSKARRDLQVLSNQVSGLFTGGDVDEEDIDAAMQSIQKAYWLAKEKNRKFTPKKQRVRSKKK